MWLIARWRSCWHFLSAHFDDIVSQVNFKYISDTYDVSDTLSDFKANNLWELLEPVIRFVSGETDYFF